MTVDLRYEFAIGELDSPERASLQFRPVDQILFPVHGWRRIVPEHLIQRGSFRAALTVVQLFAAETTSETDVRLGG
ncbi:MAG: hypothetical protein M3P26_10240 [Gemmatimonadota bacterium]|nr:hypothetical protein [Gemmatimonadota bacterium]